MLRVAIAAMGLASKAYDWKVDLDCNRIFAELASRRSWLSAGSLINRSRSLSVSRWKLLRTAEQRACALWLKYIYDFRASLRQLIEFVNSSDGVMQTLYCFIRYDETPMRCYVVDTDSLYEILTAEQRAYFDSIFNEEEKLDFAQAQMSGTMGMSKLLQTEMVVCALCCVHERWRVFSWRIPTLIFAMESTNAKCYYTCLSVQLSFLGLGEFVSHFRRFQKVSLTDGAGACEAYERGADAEVKATCDIPRHSSCLRPGPCTTHSKHNKREMVFKHYESLCKPVKSIVGVLKGGAHFKSLKEAFRVTMLMIPIYHKTANPGQLFLNSRALDLILPRDPENATKRELLLHTFQAPFASGAHEVYAIAGESEQDARERLLSKDISAAVLGSGPGSFPSRSWSQSEDAPRWVARLILLNLFDQVWEQFERLVHFKPPARFLAARVADFLPIDCGGAGLDAGEHAADAAPLPQSKRRGAASFTDMKSLQIEQAREDHKKAMVAVYVWRKSGYAFIDIWTFCLAHNPWVQLQRHDFHVASEQFDHDQNLVEAQNYLGEPSDSARQVRQHRCALAYEGKAEQRFLEHVRTLMVDSTMWAVVPPAQRTERMRTRATLVLVASACAMNKMQQQLRQYPNKLIATSQFPELLAEVKADRGCPAMMDGVSRDIVEFYDDLASAPARADVEVLARFTKLENIKIEYRNQRIRRFVVGRSNQRKVVDLRSLNIFWVNDQLEDIALGAFGSIGASVSLSGSAPSNLLADLPADPASASPTDDAPLPGPKRRKTNPFNLFQRSKCAEHAVDTVKPSRPAISAAWEALVPQAQLLLLLLLLQQQLLWI